MSEKRGTDLTPLVYVAGFLLLKDSFFGKNPDDKKAEQETAKIEKLDLKDNPFEWSSYKIAKKKGYSRLVTNSLTIKRSAEQIWDALGYVTDDESKIIDAIKKAKTKFEIALIAKFYSDLYKHNLYADLKRNLSGKATELGSINTYVNKLPKYIKGKTN